MASYVDFVINSFICHVKRLSANHVHFIVHWQKATNGY